MSLTSSDNSYYNILMKRMEKYNCRFNTDQQKEARIIIGLALRAGYRQAQIDAFKRKTPKYKWNDDEENYDDD